MPTLHVRNVPEDLHERIREIASADRRSLSGEVVVLLDEALGNRKRLARHVEALESLRRRRRVYRSKGKLPDSTQLLREDRAR